MSLRFDLRGYRTRRIAAVIDEIGTEVIGPNEAARYLGPQADAAAIAGPVVLVSAHLPEDTFLSDGKTYHYYDGMSGNAEVEIGSERVLFAVIPGLKGLL
jgi:membrane fusion protein (multidrug efflux system)